MRLLIFRFILMLILFSGCTLHTGSGKYIQKNIDGNFNAIHISGPYKVEIKNGEACSVVLETDDNLLRKTNVSIENNTLTAKIKGNNFKNAHFKLIVTSPEFIMIDGSAAADFLIVDDVRSKNILKIKLSSSSSLKGKVDAPEIHLTTSSGSKIDVLGRTKKLFVEGSSGSDIHADGLLSETTSAKASSGANISVYASISLDAAASSGGNITYKGNGNVQKQTSSGGNIINE